MSFLKSQLDADLKHIRKASSKFQAQLLATRLAATHEEKQNVFQPGDLVLFQLNPDNHLPTKLISPFLGPYRVLQQVKYDVECRHLVYISRKKKKIESECQAEARIENFKIYEKWNLKKKYNFAFSGYEFSNNRRRKAIVLDDTDTIAITFGRRKAFRFHS